MIEDQGIKSSTHRDGLAPPGTKFDVSWNEVFRRLESSCVRTSGKGPVCNYPLQTNGLHMRGGDPSD